jgi:hypothetical protein
LAQGPGRTNSLYHYEHKQDQEIDGFSKSGNWEAKSVIYPEIVAETDLALIFLSLLPEYNN